MQTTVLTVYLREPDG